ncbi:unnamed protein product [Peniophora sp. CBMAI 1063]|nr:unnamed protein product [Peniophora sp. CBMAI 1063]
MANNLQIEIARAEMEVAQKRLALLLAQSAPAQTAPERTVMPPNGDVGDVPVKAERRVQGGKPGEAAPREGGKDTADKEPNAMPPVTTIDAESMQTPDDDRGGAGVDDNGEDAHSAAAPDDNDEVESLVREDDEDAETSPVTAKTEADKANASAAPTDGDDEDSALIGPYIDRVLRWAGAVWSDAEVRPGVDFGAAADLATEMVNFEVVSCAIQASRPAPLDIKSAKQWVSKQRMASKVYATVPEPNYAQLVVETWRRIREQPYNDVMKMHGKFGLIGVVRAVYQANAVDPEMCEDFSVLMLEVADALRAMRASIGAARDAQPGQATAPPIAASASLLDVLTLRNSERTAQATEIIDRFSKADVIDIESEDEEPARGSKGGSGAGGKSRKAAAKRKSTSTPGPSTKPKRQRV